MSFRILHFSDVHLPFPPNALRDPAIFHPKRLISLLNLRVHRAEKYAAAQQKLDGLCDFLRREPVDWILYSGDTMNQGLEKEYMDDISPLSRTLSMARAGALAVPGNHDYYTRAALRHYRRFFAPRLPTGDRPDLRTPSGFPLVLFMGPDAVAIGLNSAVPHFPFWDSSGSLNPRELEVLSLLLADSDICQRKWIFLMTHYPFLDTDFLHGLRGTAPFWKLLETAGVTNRVVLLHGHNHRIYAKRTPSGIPVYCAGSLSKRDAESFWLFEPFGGALNARRGIWRNARFTLDPASPVSLERTP